MQVTMLQGYFSNGFFYQEGQRVILPERKMAIINIIDLPSPKSDIDLQYNWTAEFFRLVEASMHEELRHEDFPRMTFGRELLTFEDEGGD